MRWIGQVRTSKSWLDGTDTHHTSARVRAHTHRLTQLLSQLAGPSQALLMVAQCGKSKLIYKILVVRAGICAGRSGRASTSLSAAETRIVLSDSDRLLREGDHLARRRAGDEIRVGLRPPTAELRAATQITLRACTMRDCLPGNSAPESTVPWREGG